MKLLALLIPLLTGCAAPAPTHQQMMELYDALEEDRVKQLYGRTVAVKGVTQ